MTDDRVIDERKRYTTRLQRRAQARVTAELGQEGVGDDIDRQVAMLIQHALEATGARRVTLYRPVPKGQRWHTVTVLDDGGFYYGLIAPDNLLLPMVVYTQQRSVLLGPDRSHLVPAPHVSTLGFKTYLGLPLMAADDVIAVIEAVDVAQSDLLERYAATLTQAMEPLAESLNNDTRKQEQPGWRPEAVPQNGVTETTVLDLVLRPPVDASEQFEVTSEEWVLLFALDGEQPLSQAAAAASMPLPQARVIAAKLLERGLIRTGREQRRRS